MPELTVRNWFGDLVSHPLVIVDAHSVADIQAVLMDPSKYPAPVRAAGSNHSTTPCAAAEGGTLIRMKMNRILNVGPDSLTVEAGAAHIEMAKELERRGLQLYVNTEIGSLTAGSAACAGTKDASMPGEFGQVGSYVTGVKMVLPGGELLELTEAGQPEQMRAVRSSYGTFGVVYEVTYRIRKLTPLAVHHRTYSIAEFLAALPELKALGYSLMYYFFPFEDRITVEFRKDNPAASGEPNRTAWALRNHTWGTSGPRLAHEIGRHVHSPAIRYGIIDHFNGLWRLQLERFVESDHTSPPDQIIRYPESGSDNGYTFSLFAFPEADFPAALTDFVAFCKDYYAQEGYRSDLLYVGYWIAQDPKALLSYSSGGNVMTIDPVSTGGPGWKEFLNAYNQFCVERNGLPLLNQTFGVTREIARKAFGSRLDDFAAARRHYDPQGRLLNAYFQNLLG